MYLFYKTLGKKIFQNYLKLEKYFVKMLMILFFLFQYTYSQSLIMKEITAVI